MLDTKRDNYGGNPKLEMNLASHPRALCGVTYGVHRAYASLKD